jgi:thioesterase domain-containing protein/acyl carrier protein
VLGRGVEHQIVAALGKVALEQGLQQVMFHYKPTAKNQPVHNFLESIGHNFQLSTEDGLCFSFPASAITSLHYNPSPSGEFRDLQSETTSTPPSQPQTLDRTVKLEQIATAYSDASRILKAIKLWKKEQSPFQSRLQPVIPPQTSLQACLVQIWRDALQVEQVGIQDHYFEDLGGTSLKAVEIFVQIQQLLSLELPMTVLLQYPTVEKLAQFLDQAQVLEPWPALVPIQPNGHKTPVVCVHGGYGDVLGLQAIAKRLPADQPFYALRGIGLDGLQAPLPTIETMAARYVAELQTLQSQGPYQLMGICIGGTVAFEMAQQLIAKGQEVKWLALVDTVYPSFENYFLTRYTYYFRQGRRPLWLNRQDALYYLYDLCFYRIPSYRHRFPTWSSLITHIQNKVKQQFLKSPADQSKKSVIEDRLPFPEVADQNHQAQIKNQFYETFLSALERYQPQPYPGRIDFFLPILQTYLPTAYPHQIQSLWRKEKQILAPSQLLFGWNQVAAEFKIHEMKVRHGVMLEEPHINTVVEQLQEVLNKL